MIINHIRTCTIPMPQGYMPNLVAKRLANKQNGDLQSYFCTENDAGNVYLTIITKHFVNIGNLKLKNS